MEHTKNLEQLRRESRLKARLRDDVFVALLGALAADIAEVDTKRPEHMGTYFRALWRIADMAIEERRPR